VSVLLVGAAAAAGLALLHNGRKRGRDSSHQEGGSVDVEPHRDTGRYGEAAVLLEGLDAPYYWGGKGVTHWEDLVRNLADDNAPPWGVDCSFWACLAWEKMGIRPLDKAHPRLNTTGLANICNVVELGKQRPGDLAYYPGHVMVVLSYPGADGHSEVIGASGGRHTTFGDDPNARVKIQPTGNYRRENPWMFYMRLKPELGGRW